MGEALWQPLLSDTHFSCCGVYELNTSYLLFKKKCSSVVFRLETSVETTFSFVVCLCLHAYLSVSFIRRWVLFCFFKDLRIRRKQGTVLVGLWLVNDGLWGRGCFRDVNRGSRTRVEAGILWLELNTMHLRFCLHPNDLSPLLCQLTENKLPVLSYKSNTCLFKKLKVTEMCITCKFFSQPSLHVCLW